MVITVSDARLKLAGKDGFASAEGTLPTNETRISGQRLGGAVGTTMLYF
jgi:hypothetical protein